MNKPTLKLQNIIKTFYQGNEPLNVLRGINLEIHPQEGVWKIDFTANSRFVGATFRRTNFFRWGRLLIGIR